MADLKPYTIIDNEDMDAHIASSWFWVTAEETVMFYADWEATSSPDGDIGLETSDTIQQEREELVEAASIRPVLDPDGNQVTLKSPDGTTTTGLHAQVLTHLTGPFRLYWTRSAGTSSDQMTVKIRRSQYR